MEPALSPKPKRADGLDALRGFAILTMALSGLVPYGVLPGWMYHAQVPPPDHIFKGDLALPGITWVDLVFPFFLFSMGASMPLALSRRIKKGDRWPQLAVYVLKRGLLLAGFAIYDRHIRAFEMANHPSAHNWLLGLLGFALLFAILARFPVSWSSTRQCIIRIAGLVGALILLSQLQYPEGKIAPGFDFQRFDIIIAVLANVAVVASAAWLLTQDNWLLRLSVLGVMTGILLTHNLDGWIKTIWDTPHGNCVYKFGYQKYLCVVIPGTIVGDLILQWLKAPAEEKGPAWSPIRFAAIAISGIAFAVLMLYGLYTRWLPQTTFVAFTLCAAVWLLYSKPNNTHEQLLRKMYAWGAYWLILGLILEPFQGGIKKDHATFSYYFVTTGLAIFSLITLSIITSIPIGKKALRLLIDCGQNPMIAYSGINSLLKPVLALIGIEALMQRWLASLPSPPWYGFAWACIKTLLLALAVSFFTRRKIYWRT